MSYVGSIGHSAPADLITTSSKIERTSESHEHEPAYLLGFCGFCALPGVATFADERELKYLHERGVQSILAGDSRRTRVLAATSAITLRMRPSDLASRYLALSTVHQRRIYHFAHPSSLMIGVRLVVVGGCAAICLGLAGSAGAAHGPGSAARLQKGQVRFVPSRPVEPLLLRGRFPRLQPGCAVQPFSDGGGTVWLQRCFIG